MHSDKNNCTPLGTDSDHIECGSHTGYKKPGTCDYCHKNEAYKTNGESKNECYNKAYYNDCNYTATDGPIIPRAELRAKERLLKKLTNKHLKKNKNGNKNR